MDSAPAVVQSQRRRAATGGRADPQAAQSDVGLAFSVHCLVCRCVHSGEMDGAVDMARLAGYVPSLLCVPGRADAGDLCREALDGSRGKKPFPARLEGGNGPGEGIEGRVLCMARLHDLGAWIRRLGVALRIECLALYRLFRTVRERSPTLADGRASNVDTCSIGRDTASIVMGY
jgi:hypothetical protein